MTRGCIAQTYWYDNGTATAAYCSLPARHRVRALDGSIAPLCQEHRDIAVVAGGVEVDDYSE